MTIEQKENSSEIYSRLKLSPIKKRSFILLEDFVYKDIIVPRGYITNGADIPRIFWFFIPPDKSDNLPAVVIHDYLCWLKKYKLADKYFRECLVDCEVDNVITTIMFNAVVLYNKIMKNY